MIILAAIIFTVLTAFVIVFQIALIAGASWGRFTLGGKYPDVIPVKARVIPLISISVLLIFAIIVLIHSGLILPDFKEASTIAIWFPVAYTALGLVMNTITPSKPERILWVPVIAVMLVCTLIVALDSK